MLLNMSLRLRDGSTNQLQGRVDQVQGVIHLWVTAPADQQIVLEGGNGIDTLHYPDDIVEIRITR